MEFDDKTVYIIDSYGLIFRCYFAFISRPLTNRNGENVSALFGFFRNLNRGNGGVEHLSSSAFKTIFHFAFKARENTHVWLL